MKYLLCILLTQTQEGGFCPYIHSELAEPHIRNDINSKNIFCKFNFCKLELNTYEPYLIKMSAWWWSKQAWKILGK